MISQHSLLSTQISIAPPIQQQQHVVKPSSQSQDNPETQQTAQPCASQKPDTLHNGAVQKIIQKGHCKRLKGSQIMQVDETGTITPPNINDEGDGEDNTGNGEKVNVVMESTEVLNDGEANGSKGRKRKATKAADVGDGTERGKRGRGRGRRGK
ncbi:hypothetical protein BC829DRAFT_385664 [Chytridium lagenaria]|nr:hypothetical protein BC829DRAFT_385664 [Chytridium lagenaria]